MPDCLFVSNTSATLAKDSLLITEAHQGRGRSRPMTTPREKYDRRLETFNEYVETGEIDPATARGSGATERVRRSQYDGVPSRGRGNS